MYLMLSTYQVHTKYHAQYILGPTITYWHLCEALVICNIDAPFMHMHSVTQLYTMPDTQPTDLTNTFLAFTFKHIFGQL